MGTMKRSGMRRLVRTGLGSKCPIELRGSVAAVLRFEQTDQNQTVTGRAFVQ
jgi:hypothetical protein